MAGDVFDRAAAPGRLDSHSTARARPADALERRPKERSAALDGFGTTREFAAAGTHFTGNGFARNRNCAESTTRCGYADGTGPNACAAVSILVGHVAQARQENCGSRTSSSATAAAYARAAAAYAATSALSEWRAEHRREELDLVAGLARGAIADRRFR